MNKQLIKQGILFLMAVIILSACKKEETEEPPAPGSNIIYVTEKISQPTTWLEGFIYLIDINGDFVVESVLTIEQDVIVKFLRDKQRMVVQENASVQAFGSDEKPIIFTSKYDDVNGGDNILDGPTVGSPGDWGMIILENAAESNFAYCHFYYGGGLLYSTLEADYCTVNITNSVFAYNTGGEHFGFIGVVNLDEAASDCEFKNNVMHSNILPLVIAANISIDNSNVFHDPDNPSVGNVMNGIYTNAYTIETPVSWEETEVAFVVGNDFELRIDDAGGELTLADDVVIKVIQGTQIYVQPNSGGIINNNGTGVFFTSLFDDSLKGDTNGDDNLTSPSNGDWTGIRINDAPIEYASWDNILYAAN